ncbi:Kynurenine formamidase [Pseudodesulfovibrio hydrargyri]|uniref:Kynurenine formamidase n=1 Tax=Pseudodesulfovibrio hydrargyri TaxID=2125990 RepID=A0A1J5MZA1_9BACT|nr:cyclase family protein [Pseudodesulfovibrio hydrargyri]OIQ48731.1 Kynurenine formamidase [Pseudodesulfovibrio hydrargyri]
MNLIELTHVVVDDIQIYPGDPKPAIKPFLTHDKDYCHVNTVNLGSHTGTHIDAAFHFFPDGRKINDYPLDRFVRPGVLVDATGAGPEAPIPASILDRSAPAIEPGDFVIFRTGWSRYFGQDMYLRHPSISPELSQRMVDLGVSLVGLDALSVDPSAKGTFEAHMILLGNDVLIVENLRNLESVTRQRGIYSFLPLRLDASDGSPIRAVFQADCA